MRPPSALVVSAVALLVATGAVAAQRSSPQFSFPPPGSLAAQFGADIFGASGQQDLGVLQAPGAQSQPPAQSDASQPQPQQPQPQAQQAQQSQQQSQQPHLHPQQAQQSPQQPQQPPQQPQQPSIQLARPAPASQPSPRPQQPQAASNRDQAHQASRQHQPAHRPASTSHQSAQSGRGQHPSHLQTQATSQSLSAQTNQAATEAARKAEATAASLAAGAGQTYHCPDPFGFFRHHKSCDKYWACENGTAALKLCGNGLMFDDSDPKRENCAYPFSVDCGADRTDLEPPISTPHCPRLYGLFADTANCRVFYSCWNGEASKYECPPGLAYDNEQRVCVWADLVDRCDQSEVSDGFVCPDPTEVDQPGHYTRHAHPTDCRKFYVCIEGVARPYGCSFGTVFNVDSLQCDEPENVSGCEKYYGDMDPKLAKKLARESSTGTGPSSSGTGPTSGSGSSAGSARPNSQPSH